MSVHVLYRMFDSEGSLLYLGRTANPFARFKNHKYTKPWWDDIVRIDLQHFASRQTLINAERLAIRVEQPFYNVHNNRQPVDEPAEYDEDEDLEPCGECLNCDEGLGYCDDFFEEDDADMVLVEYS